MENETYMKRLKDRLQIEFKKQDRSGVYGHTQRSMAYNSNRIEGSTLTEKQTASMFETGTLYADDPDMIFRTKDIEEMNGHFKMFNYVMKCMEKPLSEDIMSGSSTYKVPVSNILAVCFSVKVLPSIRLELYAILLCV